VSVNALQSSQAVNQTEALSQAQSGQKQANLENGLPEDTVTISAAAQAKQTAASIGANISQVNK
jgi:hypothetical protein